MLREPLFHFFVAGAILFAIVQFRARSDENPDTAYRIDVGPERVAQLRDSWTSQAGRPPAQAELDALVESYVKEEIMFREAVKMGLDVDDAIVRRRLAQKLEFLLEDLTAPPEPTEAELQDFFQNHATNYEIPGRLAFRHIYFSPDRRADPAGDAAEFLARPRYETLDLDIYPGDPFPLQSEYVNRTKRDVASLFGTRFAESIFQVELEHWAEWIGPVESGYGYHLVNVTERVPVRLPAFDDARGRVARDWAAAWLEGENQAIYDALRERYEVVVETARDVP